MNEEYDLHDSTLRSIKFNWSDGRLRLDIIPASGAGGGSALVFDGVVDVHVPHSMPWGRSSSINSVSRKSISDGIEYLVEMQSGDVLRVVARSLSFEN